METKTDRRAEHLKKRDEYMRDATADKLGRIVSNMRTEHGFTQIQFAEKLGISQSQLSAIESGRQVPTFATMLNVSKVLNQEPIGFVIRLLAESIILKDFAPGTLKEEDFQELGKSVTENVKKLFIQKVNESE
jgi:transcriptional regulator with XRE-family HTH domain